MKIQKHGLKIFFISIGRDHRRGRTLPVTVDIHMCVNMLNNGRKKFARITPRRYETTQVSSVLGAG
jgi:hypothetical protein